MAKATSFDPSVLRIISCRKMTIFNFCFSWAIRTCKLSQEGSVILIRSGAKAGLRGVNAPAFAPGWASRDHEPTDHLQFWELGRQAATIVVDPCHTYLYSLGGAISPQQKKTALSTCFPFSPNDARTPVTKMK